MTIKIQKYIKTTLEADSDLPIIMVDSTGLAISHYVDVLRSSQETIPFTIEGTSKHVPSIGDVEFPVSIRKKVNMVAVGPNEKAIKDVGQDIGKYNYADRVPTCPPDLPPGFEELHKQ